MYIYLKKIYKFFEHKLIVAQMKLNLPEHPRSKLLQLDEKSARRATLKYWQRRTNFKFANQEIKEMNNHLSTNFLCLCLDSISNIEDVALFSLLKTCFTTRLSGKALASGGVLV